MDYVLGVDGGGTKTMVQITDVTGKKMITGTAGASNQVSVGKIKSISNLNEGIFTALREANLCEKLVFAGACFGFAGCNVPGDLEIYKKIVFNKILAKNLIPERVLICNDTRIGLEAGSNNKNRIIVIAGTGSNCFGVNEDGVEIISTGWDYIAADEGSGYSVSVRALKSIMKAFDGRGEKTLLTQKVLEYLGLKDEYSLVSWTNARPFSKEKIGSLARIVCETAKLEDKISVKILRKEAEEAVLSVSTVAEKLGFAEKSFDLVFVGGLFKCEKHFKNIIISELVEKFRGINFRPLVAEPVSGSTKLALKIALNLF